MSEVAGGCALRLTEIRDRAGLVDLEPRWRELRERANTRSPFLSFEWVSTWLDHFGEGIELRILVLEDDEGVVAIAPLGLARRRSGPLVYRALEIIGTGALRFLGMGLADRADFLIARRCRDAIVVILDWCQRCRREVDVLDLRFLPQQSETWTLLPELAAERAQGCAAETCAVSPFLELEGSFEEYLRQRGRNFRKGLERKQRELAQLGVVAIEFDALAAGRVDEVVSRVVAVSRASWKEETGSALFLHSRIERFFRDLLSRLGPRHGAYVAFLTVGGEDAAHEVGFREDRKLWSYDTAYDRRFAAGSPGNLLTARVIEKCFGDGLIEYDFLRGDEAYKSSWQSDSRAEVQLVLDSGTMRGQVARQLGFHAKWALKRSPVIRDFQARLAGLANRRWFVKGRS